MSVGDPSQLVELWAELNLSDSFNLTQLEAMVCSGAMGHSSFLQTLSFLYVLIFLVGGASNMLLLWKTLSGGRSLYSGRSLHSRQSLQSGRGLQPRPFVLHLALAQLLVVVTLPAWVGSLLQGGVWSLGGGACRLLHLLFSSGLFASIFFFTCVSVDRFLPLRGALWGGVWRCLLSAALWLLAVAAATPEVYFLQAVWSPLLGGAVCRPVFPEGAARHWEASLQLGFVLLSFALPLPVMSLPLFLLQPRGGSSGRSLATASLLLFAVCWAPLSAALLLDAATLLHFLPFSCRLENFLDAALPLMQSAALLHCCISPALLWPRPLCWPRPLSAATCRFWVERDIVLLESHEGDTDDVSV